MNTSTVQYLTESYLALTVPATAAGKNKINNVIHRAQCLKCYTVKETLDVHRKLSRKINKPLGR